MDIIKEEKIDFIKSEKNIIRFPIFKISKSRKDNNEFLVERNFENVVIKISGKSTLDEVDKQIFFSILKLAHINFIKNKDESFEINNDENPFFKSDRVIIKTSFQQLLKEAGLAKKGKYKDNILFSLDKLSETRYSAKSNATYERSIGNFIDLDIDSDENITIKVFEAFISCFKNNFYKIYLSERKEIGLKDQTTLNLHSYLSQINEKNIGKRSLEKMLEKVYGEEDIKSLNKIQVRDRKKKIRDSLIKINKLDKWKIEKIESKIEMYKVSRL